MSKNETDTPNKWEKLARETAATDQDATVENDAVADDAVAVEDLLEPEIDTTLNLGALTELENTIKALELKNEELKQQVVRTLADMENLRRRTEADVSKAHRFGNDKLITALLPVIDSLLQAEQGVDLEDPKVTAIHEGIRLTIDLLQNTLLKFGVEVIDPQLGDTFNPEHHEAMTLQEQAGAAPNTIINVLQKGYILNGRVIRAAMVIVAK